jgi:hypothetical protein
LPDARDPLSGGVSPLLPYNRIRHEIDFVTITIVNVDQVNYVATLNLVETWNAVIIGYLIDQLIVD